MRDRITTSTRITGWFPCGITQQERRGSRPWIYLLSNLFSCLRPLRCAAESGCTPAVRLALAAGSRLDPLGPASRADRHLLDRWWDSTVKRTAGIWYPRRCGLLRPQPAGRKPYERAPPVTRSRISDPPHCLEDAPARSRTVAETSWAHLPTPGLVPGMPLAVRGLEDAGRKLDFHLVISINSKKKKHRQP